MCRQRGWGLFPGTSLASRTDDQVARMVAVNGTHRLSDALAPLINVRSGAEGDKQTPNVTKMSPPGVSAASGAPPARCRVLARVGPGGMAAAGVPAP